MDWKRCWAEIDRDALRRNYRILRDRLREGERYLAVVKADAYGHGAGTVARTLETEGADWFGVATLDEGLALRAAGIRRPVLVLGYTDPGAAPVLAGERLTQTLFSADYAKALKEAALAARAVVDCHLKLDTGMGRLGFPAGDPGTVPLLAALTREPAFHVTGIFTHFAAADDPSPRGVAYTNGQYRRFADVTEALERAGAHPGLRHCCNSAATLLRPDFHFDLCRVGISQYGLSPDPSLRGRLPLRPVLSLRSVVAMVKDVPKGAAVGYGCAYTAPSDRRIATVPIGYADGYPRALGSRATMLVRGKRAPVVGRVCMDQLMLDVTGIPGVRPGDRVTAVGRDGDEEISLESIADLLGTIPYEVACGISKRVPRIPVGA